MKIFDCWYAIKVCRKYGIRWNPLHKLDCASYRVAWDGSGEITESSVSINPFHPNFLTVFMHEVGHCRLYKKGTAQKIYKRAELNRRFEQESIWLDGKLLLPLLTEESLASRFSRKALRGRANVKYLVWAYQTYSSSGYRAILYTTPEDARTITRLTDFVERGIRRIEK